MARIVPAPANAITRAFPRHSRAATRRKAACSLASRPINPVGVWRDALATFSSHSAAVLPCALLGFAAPVIAGQWVATQAVLANYAWAGPIVTLFEKPPLPTTIVLAIVALLGSSFTRGVITWLALQHDNNCETVNVRRPCNVQAVRITLTRFPSLLAGTLVYSAIAAACMLGVSLLIQSLKFERVLLKSNPGWSEPSRAMSDAYRQLVWRGVQLLPPDPGPPFAEVLPNLRAALFKPSAHVTQYEQSLPVMNGEQTMIEPSISNLKNDAEALALASVLLLALAETLLRFRTVMAFKPPGSLHVSKMKLGGERPWGFAALAPLIASARFGLRHFGVVSVHIWVLRLTIFALWIGLVELPLAMINTFIAPNAIRFAVGLPILPLMTFAHTCATALAGAIVLAFGVVYDARLAIDLGARGATHDAHTNVS